MRKYLLTALLIASLAVVTQGATIQSTAGAEGASEPWSLSIPEFETTSATDLLLVGVGSMRGGMIPTSICSAA